MPVHLEYILTEILKNSFRATVEQYQKQHTKCFLMPPVTITLSPPPRENKGLDTTFFSMRVRDQGGGVSPENMARIFSYAFTTAGRDAKDQHDGDGGEMGGPYTSQQLGGSAAIDGGKASLFGEITGKGLQTGMGTIAGLGYGLPMSKLYARCARS